MTERQKKTIVISALREYAYADAEAEAVARAFLTGNDTYLVTSSMLVIDAAIMLIAEDVADACIVEHCGSLHELGARGTERAGSFLGVAPTILHLQTTFARRTLRAREALRDDPTDMDLLGALDRRGWAFLATRVPGTVAFRKQGAEGEEDEDGHRAGDVVRNNDLDGIVRDIAGLSRADFWAEDKRRRREAKAP